MKRCFDQENKNKNGGHRRCVVEVVSRKYLSHE